MTAKYEYCGDGNGNEWNNYAWHEGDRLVGCFRHRKKRKPILPNLVDKYANPKYKENMSWMKKKVLRER